MREAAQLTRSAVTAATVIASAYRASTTDLPPGRSLLTITSTDHPEEVT
jgi:hypothetical protein